MNNLEQRNEIIEREKFFWIGGALALLAGILLAAAFLAATYYYPSRLGIPQPIPFSHRVHSHDKQISCLMCHQSVADTARAGIPPLETCMLCHSQIIVKYPYIQKLQDHYYKKVPVLWNRVNTTPDFVFFNHSAHLIRGVDCGRCHGDVKQMDRVVPLQTFTMGFCVQCHRDYNASHDCFFCHR